MTVYANTRMYDVNPAVAELWRRLVAEIARLSGVDLVMLSHPAPAPVEALWARSDLGLVMMCGWPFARAIPSPKPVAVPVLEAAGTSGKAVYWSDMIVRADAPFQRLEETFGGTIAWTVKGSHSGYNAPRHLLAPHFKTRQSPLFRNTFGPVVTPRAAIGAVTSGQADIAPLDGYFHALLKRHEPETAALIRTVARTESAPMPLFTASHCMPDETVEALRSTLLGATGIQTLKPMLADLLIADFIPCSRDDYSLGDEWDAEARAAGYPEIA